MWGNWGRPRLHVLRLCRSHQARMHILEDMMMTLGKPTRDDDVRVNDCLHGYCPKRSLRCWRCDRVKAILAKHFVEHEEGQDHDRSAV